MTTATLFEAVSHLAEVSHALDDAALQQPFRWRAHREGVRQALLGSYHELRDLAVTLAHRRAQQGPLLTLAQRALGPYHLAYRELQAQLVGIPEALYEEQPAPGEWHARDVLTHVIATSRAFFTLVHYGLERQRDGEERSPRLPEGEVERVVDSREAFAAVWRDGTLSDLLGYFEDLHRRTLHEFSTVSDDELQGPSIWWEGEALSLQYRLHRFDVHVQQHALQLEKTLEAVGQPVTEARRLIRLLYRALAEVENAVLGAPDFAQAERQALAQRFVERAAAIETVGQQAGQMIQSALSGDTATVQQILQDNADLAECVDENLLPVALAALYRGHEEIAAMLAAAQEEIDIFTAAALGQLDQVQARAGEWDGYVNETARDGFTPLQLACYFGREATALWLLDHGAEVEAVSRNGQRIRPIHAAAANGNLNVLRALLARGADVNARQQQDFTPLHTAADRGDGEMARLFLEHGADAEACDAQGRTPGQLAQERGHDALASLLS